MNRIFYLTTPECRENDKAFPFAFFPSEIENGWLSRTFIPQGVIQWVRKSQIYSSY